MSKGVAETELVRSRMNVSYNSEARGRKGNVPFPIE